VNVANQIEFGWYQLSESDSGLLHSVDRFEYLRWMVEKQATDVYEVTAYIN
jgi:hypothetical protein